MQNGLTAIETQRNQLLQARLDQLQEILSAKKEKLKELYQLLKFRDSLGDLLHASTADENLAPEEDDAGCNAFVELYEHGGIGDLPDWPMSDESSAVSLSHEPEPEPSSLPSERAALAGSPQPAPSEPLVPSAPVSPPAALASRPPSLPPSAVSPSHLSPPPVRSPAPDSPAQSPLPRSPEHLPPAPTVPESSPHPPHSPVHALPPSPPRSPARSPSRSPPRPPSPSVPLPSPPRSPPSVSPLPPSSPLPPPSPSPPSSPSLSASPSRSPSAKPVPELPYDESQDVDRLSDLASDAAPRQEVLIPSSPEPSPETQVPEIPVKDDAVEEETVEPNAEDVQPPLSETVTIDETVVQETAVNSLPPSPPDDAMQEVIVEGQEEDAIEIEDADEPTVIVQTVSDNVRSPPPVHEVDHSSPLMVSSEMPSPEETEAIAVKSDGDEDEEKAVSQSVVAEPDLRESPDRDLKTHAVSRGVSPEVVAAVSPVTEEPVEETTATTVEEVEEAAVLPSEAVDQMQQEAEMDIDFMEEEQDIKYDADMNTDVAAVEKSVSDVEELVEEEAREEVVSVLPEVLEAPAQEEVAQEEVAQEEMVQEDQIQEETAEEVPVVEETVLDKESPPTPPPPPPEAQETDNSRPTNVVQAFDDYVEEGIPSPIEDAQIPLLRPMGLIPSPNETDSPTRSPSGSLTRSPSIVPELPSSQVGDRVDVEDDVQPLDETQEVPETQETQETQEIDEAQEAQEPGETQEEIVYTGRVTRSRSRVLTDSPALKTQRIPTKSPSIKDEIRKAELEELEVEVEEVDDENANEVVTAQEELVDEGRELSVVFDEIQEFAASDEKREASVAPSIQDTAVSRQVSEQRDFDRPQSIEASVSPAVMESREASPEGDVDMEDVDVDVSQTMPELPSPVSVLVPASGDDLADQTDVKMEGDQTPLNAISPKLLFRFPPVSPRPSQIRTLLVDAVPSTIISGVQSSLFDYSTSTEHHDEDEKGGVLALDAQMLPDTTLPPMPMSPMLTPYVNSIALPEDLPAVLARKVHPAKLARKRDREREKDAKEDNNKDKKDSLAKGATWLPWEVSRWGAHIRANAAHKMVRRTGKVLTTKMWSVAHNELKLSRTLERIERLKQEGRWSFRQPKKQKGPLVSKSHWDWMLDEMKWMSTDFREERIWKTTVAFNLAHDIRLWHSATPEERKMLCVPRSAVQGGIDNIIMAVEPAGAKSTEQHHIMDKPLGTVELPSVEDMANQTPDGPWLSTEELDVEKEADLILRRQREQRNIDEAKNQAEQDSLDADGEDDADGEMDVDVEEEEVEPVFDLPPPPPVDAEESQPIQVPESSQENPVETPPSTEIGLKNLSSDLSAGPTLSSAPEKLPGTTVTDAAKTHVRTSLHNIADDELFLDIEKLCSGLSLSTLEDHTSLDLPELFSDYQVYQPLFPSPELAETAVLPRTDKKAEKKERKVIEELTRVDETTLSKVVNVSTFMQYRPLLVSALQPAKRYRDGKWINLEDIVVSSDDTAAAAAAEPPPDHLFGPQRTRPPGVSLYSLGTRMPKDGQKRVNETPWSNSEDSLLKDIAERYPNNWGLIADMFNSSRVTISNDQRTAWDCMVRWDLRWNEGKLLTPPAVPTTPEVSVSDIPNVPNPTQTPLHGQAVLNALMTRKRSVGQLSLTLPSQPAESRKRRRHNHMHEAMKKSAKKRETAMKQIIPNRRQPQIHETHNAFKQPTHKTPAELSRLKAEKDRREFEEQQLRRKQQEEDIMRKRQMELRQQQQQQMQSAQPVSVPHVRGPNHPQVNISQQAARLPNAVAGNLPVPNVPPNPQMPAGVNLNTPSLPRFTPEQQRAFQMQMQQARLAQAQAQAQAHLQQAQAQAQAQAQRSPVQQQVQQLGQSSQQQPQPQPQPHPQSQQQQPQQPQQLHPQQQAQMQPQQQQQHQQHQPNMAALANGVPNAAQHVLPGTTAAHAAMHPHSSPIPTQATIHHSGIAQITPPRLGTPGNVNVNLMGMNTGGGGGSGTPPIPVPVVRPPMPQIAHQQRPGSTPQMPSVPSQPPRPTSTQLPLQAGQMVGQMMRQTALQQQHQHHQQQQQALHHASMQNMHNSGLTQEQIKRLYQSQLYWSNPQMHAAAAAANAQMAYAQSPSQQQPQTPQQQISSPRPPSVQPHSNITPSPAPPS